MANEFLYHKEDARREETFGSVKPTKNLMVKKVSKNILYFRM